MWSTEINLHTPAEGRLFVGLNPNSMSMCSLRVHIGNDTFEGLHSYTAATSTSLSMEIRSLKSDQLSDDRYKLSRYEARHLQALSGGQWNEAIAGLVSYREFRLDWNLLLVSPQPGRAQQDS